jgi:dTDP-4-amino-4,6-dideoxygalactose transaminase
LIHGLNGLANGAREVERFRAELKAHFGVRYCFLVSSGKAALTLILRALHDLQPRRDEVLIPAYCCYSVPSAIERAGLKIRICESDVDTLDYDYAKLGDGLCPDPKILAAVSVHLFGMAGDTDRLRQVLCDRGVAIVEDAAQAMGAESRGRKLGLVGDVGFFSLGRGKALSTVEGGIIVTRRDEIAAQIRKRVGELRDYRLLELILLMVQALALFVFQRPAFFWIPKMLPFLKVGDTFYEPRFRMRRLSAFQAGIAQGWLARLERFRKRRRELSDHWSGLALPVGISAYARPHGPAVDFIRYPLRITEPELWAWTLERSRAGGHGVMLTYPDAVCGIPALKDRFDGKRFPAARRLAAEILTLPVHPLLSDRDLRKIELLIDEAGARSRSRRPATSKDEGKRGTPS